MPQKKRRTSIKQRKKVKADDPVDKISVSPLDEDFNANSAKESFPSENCNYNQYDDNISLYERENIDLLDTIDGVKYDMDEFRQQFPHLAEELGDPNLVYPIDAVRWEDDACIDKEIVPFEEPNIESLLRRSKTREEALEIIKYLEKQGEITSQVAKKIIFELQSKGLKVFKSKKRK